MIVLLVLYFAVELNKLSHTLVMNEKVLNQASIIGLIILFIIIIGQHVCNVYLVLLDIDRFDEEIRNPERNINNLDRYISFIIVICVIGFGIVVLCRKNSDMVNLIIYSIVMISVGIGAVYNSFISLYVKVRCWYHVDEIIIRTKITSKVYSDIFHYRRDSDMYEFVYVEDCILKHVIIPVDMVESIEKRIDTEKTYLDTMRKTK